MNTPLISIIIPLYNNEAYIVRAIESCLNQSYSPIEVIVVDDCSQDHSLLKVKTFINDHRVKLLSNTHNLGTFLTRIQGSKQAQGEYICFLDSDDFFRPDALKTFYKEISQGDFDIIYANYFKNGKESRSFGTLPFLVNLKDEEIFKAVFDPQTWTGSRWTQIAKLYKTSIIKESIALIESLSLKDTYLICSEDLVFSTVILFFAKQARIINKVVLDVSVSESSTTNNHHPEHKYKLRQSDQRAILILNLIAKHNLIIQNSYYSQLLADLIKKVSYEFYANQRHAQYLLTLEGETLHAHVYEKAVREAMKYGNFLRCLKRLLCFKLSFQKIQK